MAENKILNTRIALKFDSLSAWNSSTVKLRPGEVAFAYIESANGGNQVYGNVNSVNQPTVLFKVGVGDPAVETSWKKFSELPWGSALAADVYSWAKKSEDEFKAYLSELLEDGVVGEYATVSALSETNTKVAANEEAIGALQTKVGSTSVQAQITAALEAANLDQYATDTELKAATDDIAELKTNKADKSVVDELVTKVGTSSVQAQIEAAIEAENLAQYATDTELAETNRKVTALEGTVGDSTSGLVKNVADLTANKADKSVVDELVTKVGTSSVEAQIEAAFEAANLDQYATDTELAETNRKVTALEGTVGDSTKGLVKAAADLEANKADKTTVSNLETRVATNEDAIEVLNGNDTVVGSVDKKIADAFNEFITKETADDVVNTYKELINYAKTHGSEATEMATAISTLEGEMDTAQADISALQTKVGSTSVQAQIEAAIEAENLAQYATDTELEGVADRVSELEDTVGDSSEGLVKDVADLKANKADKSVVDELVTKVGTSSVQAQIEAAIEAENLAQYATDTELKAATDDIAELQGTVGDSTKGLVKSVADLTANKAEKSVVDELVTKVGTSSVQAQIEAAIEAENLAQYATDTELEGVADRVTALEETVGDSTKGLVKAVAAKAEQSDLDETNTKVDGLISKFGTEEDNLILNCGTSTVNVY